MLENILEPSRTFENLSKPMNMLQKASQFSRTSENVSKPLKTFQKPLIIHVKVSRTPQNIPEGKKTPQNLQDRFR